MLTKDINIARFDVNQENKTLSIRLDTVIKEDDVELSRKSHRCAFAPGDILKVKEYLGMEESAEIDYLKAIWTKEVISEYKAMIEAQDA